MNLKLFIAGLVLTAASGTLAQTAILSTTSNGYLSRGILMYEAGNYNGAIDQLSYTKGLPTTFSEQEKVDYYIAKCYFNLGNPSKALELLNKYLVDYPTSFNNPDVYTAIGDIYFYNGDYAEAIPSYKAVKIDALNAENKEDVIYRLAYSLLRVKEGDSVDGKTLAKDDVDRYRKQAKTLFDTLSATERYSNAAKFYQAYLKYE